jgi:hypothetical protein
MRQEFELAQEAGLVPLPIGNTGFMAEEIWKEINGAIKKFIPSANDEFEANFARLGDPAVTPQELMHTVSQLINYLQKN